jgi:hypothetical protein
MLYVADFNFDSERADDRDWHGHFNILVEADNIASATRKLRAAIRRHKSRKNGALASATTIYMQSLVEISEVPLGGVLCYLETSPGEYAGGINVSTPGSSAKGVVAYGYGREEGGELEPFLSFEPKPAKQSTRAQSNGSRSRPQQPSSRDAPKK